MKPQRLLPLETFAPVFEPFRGKRVGLVTPYGNVGDSLIAMATEQLLDAFHIDWVHVCPESRNGSQLDELAFGGGGNMGLRYRNNWELRNQIFQIGLPVTILPQSFNSEECRNYQRVFVRDLASIEFCPEGRLAPDLALGLQIDPLPSPRHRLGVFLRRDRERVRSFHWFCKDPARICKTPLEYLHLASQYQRIVTDRLHFAICGLLAGRRVTLLPNDYHKNRSMYETWLKDLGCEFAENWWTALRNHKRTSTPKPVVSTATAA